MKWLYHKLYFFQFPIIDTNWPSLMYISNINMQDSPFSTNPLPNWRVLFTLLSHTLTYVEHYCCNYYFLFSTEVARFPRGMRPRFHTTKLREKYQIILFRSDHYSFYVVLKKKKKKPVVTLQILFLQYIS